MWANIESGVANHVLTTGHNLDFDKARVVYPCTNTTKRHVESALLGKISDLMSMVQN